MSFVDCTTLRETHGYLFNEGNGDIRCFYDWEFVNVRCWKCHTSRQDIDKLWQRYHLMFPNRLASPVGFEQKELLIRGKVSRHNSPRDKVDDVKWEVMCEEVKKLLTESTYTDLWKSLDLEID